MARPAPPDPDREDPSDGDGPDDVGDPGEGQGRGQGGPDPKPARARKRRQPAGGEVRGRKLQLPDEIHDRLWLMARQKRTTVSAVAADILDKNLPKFVVTREG